MKAVASRNDDFNPGAIAATLHALSLLLPPGSPRSRSVDFIASSLLDRLAKVHQLGGGRWCASSTHRSPDALSQVAKSASPTSLAVALYSMAQLGYRPGMLRPKLMQELLKGCSSESR